MPGKDVRSDDELRDYARVMAARYHASGTGMMGQHPLAVVDDQGARRCA
jgi:hypothetical protein